MSNKIKKVIVLVWTAFTEMLPEMISPWDKNIETDLDEYLYVDTIVFDSLKKAFPESEIKVVCVGKLSGKRRELLLQKTNEVQATSFIETEYIEPQDKVLRNIIFSLSNFEEPVALVDSDIIFWDRFDDVSDSLYEGYFVPSYEECYSNHPQESKVFVHENIHAAFLKIKNPKLLAEKILNAESQYPLLDLCKPTTVNRIGNWEHYDTLSLLHSMVSKDVRKLNKKDLSKFVHLYGGNQLDYYTYMMFENNPRSLELSKLYEKIHLCVKNQDYEKLKGLWGWYKEYKFELLT